MCLYHSTQFNSNIVIKTEKRCILRTLIHTLWRNKYCVYINSVQSGSEVQKRNNKCSLVISLGTSSKKSIFNFSAVEQPVWSLSTRTVLQNSHEIIVKENKASSIQVHGERKRSRGLWFMEISNKKRVFNYLQRINDEAFPLSKVYCISCSILKCSKVQFLAACSPACVSHGQSIISNWGKWRPCDMSHLCIITNTSNCSVLPYHR